MLEYKMPQSGGKKATVGKNNMRERKERYCDYKEYYAYACV